MSSDESQGIDRYHVMVDTNRNFLLDRPLIKDFNHASLSIVLRMLATEVEEAIETVERGDAIIEDKSVAIEQELADIGIFIMTAFDILGSDMYSAIMEKQARNYLKYPAYLFQEGDYQTQRPIAKTQWQESGGTDLFYNGDAQHIIDFDAREKLNTAQ